MMKKIKKNYKMTIAYDGSGYKGWQRLTNEPGTIQGTIERVLSEIEGSPVKISGSGRTDAGVHAKGQVAQCVSENKRGSGVASARIEPNAPGGYQNLSRRECFPVFPQQVQCSI